MDARNNRAVVSTAIQGFAPAIVRTALLAVLLLASMGASLRTANFIVETPDPVLTQQVSQAAEQFRRDLAIAWLGKTMPNWSKPCPLTVQAAPNLGAGGKTTFVFDNGEVFGWKMEIQGSPERVVDSVLPHEITHMIFASHFRRPLPRWADEGGATSVEHYTEKNKYRQILNQCLHTGRGIAFSPMFAMMDYPPDYMSLYAEGYSLAEYLILVGGRQEYVKFLDDGLKGDDWAGAVQRHYRRQDLGTLQNAWLVWVKEGAPLDKQLEVAPAAGNQLASVDERRPRPEPNLIYHVAQSGRPTVVPPAGLVPVRLPGTEAAASPETTATGSRR
ncbi:MAG: hypothetical protein LLG00_11530 [Planctomycetaceae bacterium]|nr:hypothetical protein [Planctomycetaceae bacterium]